MYNIEEYNSPDCDANVYCVTNYIYGYSDGDGCSFGTGVGYGTGEGDAFIAANGGGDGCGRSDGDIFNAGDGYGSIEYFVTTLEWQAYLGPYEERDKALALVSLGEDRD